MNYEELVKVSRSASTISSAWEKLMLDAAAAIEALQAEQKKTVTQIFGEEQQEWEEYCTGLMNRIMELKAQLPKRGEWLPIIEVNEYGEPIQIGVVCSRCGEPFQYEPKYCPECGSHNAAKTEVQDG